MASSTGLVDQRDQSVSAHLSTYHRSQSTTIDPESPVTDRAYWTQYFQHDNLASTEVRVLQGEGAYLSSVLQKAFPEEAKDTWSYEDLHKAVETSRHAWESKERLGKGKPQKLFHSLMQKFDMHSTLFQIFPSSNTYTSLVAGAATMLVKASTNHSKTIEELSNALDSISDAIGLCTIESKLIRSQHMQTAIAKLYIAVFLFFGDAILWYKSSSTSKVLHSLHRDFSERFRKSIDTIKVQAEAVRNAAELGSQAEVRVVRLDVEHLREELNDARIGLSGELRALAEYLVWQHGENVKQHELTQALLSAFRADTLGFPMLRSITPEPRSEATNMLALPAAAQTSELPVLPSLDFHAVHELLQKLVSWQMEHDGCGVRMHSKPSQTLFDQSLTQVVNKWLYTPAQQLLYLEFLSSDQTSRVDHALARQITRVLSEAKLPVAMFGQMLRRKERDQAEKDSDADLVFAMLTLAMDVIQQLPKDDRALSPVWSALQDHDPSCKVDFTTAIGVLEAAFHAAPDNLHIVLLGYPTLWSADESKIKRMVDLVRESKRSDETGVRMIIISPRKLHNTLKVLHAEEIVSLRASSINRWLQAPIVIRRAKPDKA